MRLQLLFSHSRSHARLPQGRVGCYCQRKCAFICCGCMKDCSTESAKGCVGWNTKLATHFDRPSASVCQQSRGARELRACSAARAGERNAARLRAGGKPEAHGIVARHRRRKLDRVVHARPRPLSGRHHLVIKLEQPVVQVRAQADAVRRKDGGRATADAARVTAASLHLAAQRRQNSGRGAQAVPCGCAAPGACGTTAAPGCMHILSIYNRSPAGKTARATAPAAP